MGAGTENHKTLSFEWYFVFLPVQQAETLGENRRTVFGFAIVNRFSTVFI